MINTSFLKKHKVEVTTFMFVHLKLLTILLLLLATYNGVYSSRTIFPDEAYLVKISKMFDSGLIGTDVTSRSPTGWLSDSATECLSLGVGLEKKTSVGDQFLDTYSNPLNGYNPCMGLMYLSKGENQNIENGNYARYWHGHATITQWLSFFLGLPVLRNLIWLLNFLLIFLIFKESKMISRTKKSQIVVGAMIVAYLALSDGADIHTSITHLMANSFLFLSVFYFLKVSRKSSKKILQNSFVLGSLYCFVLYGLNPQNIPIAILSWGFVILLTSNQNTLCVFKKTCLFLYGWTLGYFLTFASKWFIVVLITDYDIFRDVQSQVSHRTSQSSSSLSAGVAQHLEFASTLPAFIQAWIANLATLLIHIIDPRYSERITVIFVSVVLIGISLFVMFIMFSVFIDKKVKLRIFVATNAVSLCLLLSWYTILAQHSFDHATYTFRSLVIWLGGLIGTTIFIIFDKYKSVYPNLFGRKNTDNR